MAETFEIARDLASRLIEARREREGAYPCRQRQKIKISQSWWPLEQAILPQAGIEPDQFVGRQ